MTLIGRRSVWGGGATGRGEGMGAPLDGSLCRLVPQPGQNRADGWLSSRQVGHGVARRAPQPMQ